jgi:hypothetical protein
MKIHIKFKTFKAETYLLCYRALCFIYFFAGWKLNILESVAATLAIGLSVDFTLHYGVAYSAAVFSSASPQGHLQSDPVTTAVTQMCGPVSMAALTTLLPGNLTVQKLQA